MVVVAVVVGCIVRRHRPSRINQSAGLLNSAMHAEQASVRLLMARGRFPQAQATLESHCSLYDRLGCVATVPAHPFLLLSRVCSRALSFVCSSFHSATRSSSSSARSHAHCNSIARARAVYRARKRTDLWHCCTLLR